MLYECENGRRTINSVPKERKPVDEYLKKQGRFSKITKAQIAEIQKEVDKNFNQLLSGVLLHSCDLKVRGQNGR
jgi:pyruvate ferredoxin oxidoreductase beta subunit